MGTKEGLDWIVREYDGMDVAAEQIYRFKLSIDEIKHLPNPFDKNDQCAEYNGFNCYIKEFVKGYEYCNELLTFTDITQIKNPYCDPIQSWRERSEGFEKRMKELKNV